MARSRKPKITKEQGDQGWALYKTTPFSVRTVAIRLNLDVAALQSYAKRHKWGARKAASRDRDISQVEHEFSQRRREVVNAARDGVAKIHGQVIGTLAELAEEAAGARDVEAIGRVVKAASDVVDLAAKVYDLKAGMSETAVTLRHLFVPQYVTPSEGGSG